MEILYNVFVVILLEHRLFQNLDLLVQTAIDVRDSEMSASLEFRQEQV